MSGQNLDQTESGQVLVDCARFDEIIVESEDELAFVLMKPKAEPQTNPTSDQSAQQRE
jgi:hypothetical protein